MSSKLAAWFEAQAPKQEYQAPTKEQLEAEIAARNAKRVSIKFWSGTCTFQNGNDEPVKVKVNGQAHQTKLLRRAMELARDEGKKLEVANGMDSAHFDKVTDQDIKTHCREY